MKKHFIPKKVYRCACLKQAIASCLLSQTYDFDSICMKIIDNVNIAKIYCAACGKDKEDVVFSCGDHTAMIMLAMNNKKNETVGSIYFKNYLKYIKKYLKKTYCHFPFVDFDLHRQQKIN